MAKRRSELRKQRTPAHVIADLAIHHVEGHVLRCGYVLQSIAPDYGLDLAITTFSQRGELENGLIWLQVKASDRPRRTQAALTVRIDRKDLLSWVGEQYPVILVMYDASADQACWLHVQAEYGGGKVFGLRGRADRITVQVPLAQVVSEAAIREFRRLKAAAIAQWQ